MLRMRRRCLLLGCVGVAWLGACGSDDEPLSRGCTERAQVERAVQSGGRLTDGTRLSECLERATSPAALQNLGAVLTAVAEDLEARAGADPAAAERLGYLIGAARRGIAGTDGLGAELARRLERSGAAVSGAAAAAALGRGLREGEESG
jgi:hypothetical protein